jgi:hypothetical protein
MEMFLELSWMRMEKRKKLNAMMKINYIAMMLLFTLGANAQEVLSLEQAANFMDDDLDLPVETTKIYDLNNTLDEFIGTWTGSYNGNTIQIIVSRNRNYNSYSKIESDEINAKYYIHDTNGDLIVGSSMTGLSKLVGIDYSNSGYYELRLQDACNRARAIYIKPFVDRMVRGNNNNSEKRILEFAVMPDTLTGMSISDDTTITCISTTDYLPITESVILHKQ